QVHHNSSGELEIIPGQTVTNDLAYSFGEVVVHISSPMSGFYSPEIYVYGGLRGQNFLGQPVDYSIERGIAQGTPRSVTNIARSGQIRLLLPEGSYTLYPHVVACGVGSETIALAPLNVTVGPAQHIEIGNCLQMNLAIPAHSFSQQISLAGSIQTSCSN